jgi:hypothetical protein
VTRASLAMRGDADAWQSIEALRLGVVPLSLAEAYTVGREAEVASLRHLLEQRQGMRILFGDYGHGKTHLLDLLEQLARQEGFVTARGTLDPAEVPPSHPLRLYRALMSGMRCPDAPDASPLPILDRLAQSREHLEPSGGRHSRFLTPALAGRARSSELFPQLLEYVHGHDVDLDDLNRRMGWYGIPSRPLLKLSDFRTFGRVYAHLVGTWATWCKDAGYKGLVVLLDEVERVSALDAEHHRLAEQVLRHYAAVALAPQHLAFDPESRDAMYRGGQRVHQELPLRFVPDQPLAVVMALTPAPEVESLVQRMIAAKGVRIDLPVLERRLHGALVDRVANRYRAAYPDFALREADVRRLREQVLAAHPDDDASPRRIVRAAVFLLDGLRLEQAPAEPSP